MPGCEGFASRPGTIFRGGDAIATANILLIRHAAHDHLGRILSGRTEGVPLSLEGVQQAQALAVRMQRNPPDIVHSSPVQRARETAEHLAKTCSAKVEIVPELQELDFGDWTGRSFQELAGHPEWKLWNNRRSVACPPGGETMVAAQERAMAHLREAAERFTGKTVAMVTHCDIIRAVVACVLGLSLDRMLRFDIGPASISRIAAGQWGERVASLNEGGA